ncbi:TIGR04283 family arsenosugar biosynthesis glycosyltransferase [Arenicella xantha]|uniref:RSAM/selenodomain-associated transferase 2 n=1 Tax=Arenicella xantha TaxID=644221 RepID=A0A395JV01_9GAMM|nr:TIGR04283 family arsenosugar biosynthesis glycosyltransferase [Arenicella xantha]RBP53378.1 rSAM/selenodomain-associated transferase 2 [Arenicella xantha]
MPNVKHQPSRDIAGQQNWAIIVPILNEVASLPYLLEHLIEQQADQVILVDGGSTDGTRELLVELPANFRVVYSAMGRAKQMNAGASVASKDVLLFLHADTRLPPNAVIEVKKAKDWGRFDVQFDSDLLAMRIIAFFINGRSRLTSIATGDQALFIRRGLFEQIGRYPELPLMEDVAFCKQLKSTVKPYCSKLKVTTSARRWQQHGVVKTVLQMWLFRLAFYFGVSPEVLKRRYLDPR